MVTLATWRGAGVLAMTAVPVALMVPAPPQAPPVLLVKVTVGVPVAYEPARVIVTDFTVLRPTAVAVAPVPPPPVKPTVGVLV
jgi:hypothetical protein